MFVKFLHCKVILFSFFPNCILWKEVTRLCPYLRVEELWSMSLRAEYLHKFFIILLYGKNPLPCICLFNYLYQYGFMDIYFTTWVIIQYYIIYSIAQIIPVLAIWSCCTGASDIPSLVFLKHIFTFWHYKMLQTHLVHSLSQF